MQSKHTPIKDGKTIVSRRIVRARAAREWLSQYAGAAQKPLVLMLVGIKDLKQINERLGRTGGDTVIRKAGVRIGQFASEYLDDVEMIARLPGRELLLAIGGSHETKWVEGIAKKLLDTLSADLGTENEPVHISARIGIAIATEEENGTELLHRAGLALSKAYGRKGKRLIIAEVALPSAGSFVTGALDAGLRNAIESRQIAIMLQPQFEVATGRLTGAEALARWQHPEFGEVGAGQLFAAADRCDLREELSHLIQQEAIAIAAHWPTAINDLRLAVNLGAEELGEGYSVRILEILSRTGFAAERLTLELTEESLVRDIEQAAAQLELLRSQNIRIAVDDFGTGYSSLAYLKTLPLDYLKIDKGMTPDIGGTGKDLIVLRAIIAMGKALGLQIIAEGVEHLAELEMLQAEDCDYFQGYLRSAPLTPEAFVAFALRSN
jgi:diguanylate cyclase